MMKLEVLNLDRCDMGHAGVEALAEAWRGGACANLKQLYINCRGVNGRGLGMMVQAFAAGACPKLRLLLIQNSICDHLREALKGVLAGGGRGDVKVFRSPS